jgi:hypothetical protein
MQTGALAGSTALPLWVLRASAQAQSTLNALPRVALIIGNTNYIESPLKNPGNDAKAIAGELQKVGFKTNLQLDTAARNSRKRYRRSARILPSPRAWESFITQVTARNSGGAIT